MGEVELLEGGLAQRLRESVAVVVGGAGEGGGGQVKALVHPGERHLEQRKGEWIVHGRRGGGAAPLPLHKLVHKDVVGLVRLGGVGAQGPVGQGHRLHVEREGVQVAVGDGEELRLRAGGGPPGGRAQGEALGAGGDGAGRPRSSRC